MPARLVPVALLSIALSAVAPQPAHARSGTARGGIATFAHPGISMPGGAGVQSFRSRAATTAALLRSRLQSRALAALPPLPPRERLAPGGIPPRLAASFVRERTPFGVEIVRGIPPLGRFPTGGFPASVRESFVTELTPFGTQIIRGIPSFGISPVGQFTPGGVIVPPLGQFPGAGLPLLPGGGFTVQEMPFGTQIIRGSFVAFP